MSLKIKTALIVPLAVGVVIGVAITLGSGN